MTAFKKVWNKLKEITDINAAIALMAWDQETYMPKNSAAMRSQQISTLAGIKHTKYTQELPELVAKVDETSLTDFELKNFQEIKRDLGKQQALPQDFVIELSKTTAQAQSIWEEAKAESDFKKFAPILEKLVEMKKQEAEYYTYEKLPYDALLDEYEPGLTTKTVKQLFETVKPELLRLYKKVQNTKAPNSAFLTQNVNRDLQWNLSLDLARQFGFDFEIGRQDISTHPFTINFAASDVRITTMISENEISDVFFSTAHEVGHGLYEQGLIEKNYGLPASEACSLSIHESQSRFWENNIAKSEAFWEFYFEKFAAVFPDKLQGQSPFSVFQAVNQISPNPIRIQSDELTYHFHILLRFEIENELINNNLKITDLPELWNSKVKEYLGLEISDPSKGVLQDVHWAHGSFGYFPTYSLGSFYAAQFYHQAEKSIPNLEENIKNGEFSLILNWLRENIHQHGRMFRSEELCEKVTGEKLNVQYFVRYMEQKIDRIYA